jgi:hypothetical protein
MEKKYIAKVSVKDQFQTCWTLYDENNNIIGDILKYKVRNFYQVSVYNPEIPEMLIACSSIENLNDALSWVRSKIEEVSGFGIEYYMNALEGNKNSRYRAEMSDDFAYSNGTIARYDRLISAIERKIASLS